MASRRLPPLAILAATAIATAAAVGTFALLDARADDAAGDRGDSDAYELAPVGDLPDSVDGVQLGALGDNPAVPMTDLLTGRPIVVNFFASWCAPCVDEMPAFERVHQDLGDEVTFVGLDENQHADDALATVEATGVTYPTYDDPADALTYFGGVQMPTTVFVAADGTPVEAHSGALTEQELRDKLAELFGVDA